MRKTLIAIAAYFALVVPAHAQWAVIDSSNLVQNLRNAISTIRQEVVQAEEPVPTYQQVMMQVKQLEQLPGEVVGELKGGLFDGLSQTLGIQKRVHQPGQGPLWRRHQCEVDGGGDLSEGGCVRPVAGAVVHEPGSVESVPKPGLAF